MRFFKLALITALLFVGCANKKIATKYYKEKNYEKAYEEYYNFAKRGFPDASYKLARMIYLNKVNKPPHIEKKYALYAYENGYDDAAIIVADAYFREKDYKNALFWYDRADFEKFRMSDFKNYIESVLNLPSFKEQNRYLQKLEDYAKKSKNPKLLTMLGKFYLDDTPFHNPQKAVEYLEEAYNEGFYQAGVILGVYLIKSGEDKKRGYELLKEMAYKDPKAAYYVGNYLYDEMVQKEKLMNYNCITTNFDNPDKFFVKKLTIYKFNDLFTRKNVAKAYRISYDLGNKKALYKLIRLDIEDNTFELDSNNTYSGFKLRDAVTYLNSQDDVESKLVLAKIYEKYLYLHSYKKAKEIYKWYIQIDKLQAYWHLYQYEKRFEDKINYFYLDYLVEKKFVPAIIEKAYQQALLGRDVEKNREILEYYAKQGNLLALNYLGSLYSNQIYTPKTKSFYYYKLACMGEKKPFYIPSEDLKIANYYDDVGKDKEKYMTINYYYAQMKNRQAQLNTAKFYKHHCEYKKLEYWLKELKKEADLKGEKYYYSAVLVRDIEGNFKEAFEYIKKQNDLYSYLVLGDIYANGYYVDFDPVKAEEYYNKAYKLGYDRAIYKIASVYEKINVTGKYFNKLKSLYEKAVKVGLKDAKVKLARLYFSEGKRRTALKILKSMKDFYTNPKARYLAYLITGKIDYVAGINTNYGYLLLAKAQIYSNKAPGRALYYAFRAMLCNTPESPRVAMQIMKIINSAKAIERIYKKAKSAPKCTLN